jgi:hypothetical protein
MSPDPTQQPEKPGFFKGLKNTLRFAALGPENGASESGASELRNKAVEELEARQSARQAELNRVVADSSELGVENTAPSVEEARARVEAASQ